MPLWQAVAPAAGTSNVPRSADCAYIIIICSKIGLILFRSRQLENKTGKTPRPGGAEACAAGRGQGATASVVECSSVSSDTAAHYVNAALQSYPAEPISCRWRSGFGIDHRDHGGAVRIPGAQFFDTELSIARRPNPTAPA